MRLENAEYQRRNVEVRNSSFNIRYSFCGAWIVVGFGLPARRSDSCPPGVRRAASKYVSSRLWTLPSPRLNTLASQDAMAGRARPGLRENRPNKKPLDQQLRDYPFIKLLVMSGMLALCVTGATHSKAHATQLVISATLFVLRRLYYQIGILRCDS